MGGAGWPSPAINGEGGKAPVAHLFPFRLLLPLCSIAATNSAHPKVLCCGERKDSHRRVRAAPAEEEADSPPRHGGDAGGDEALVRAASSWVSATPVRPSRGLRRKEQRAAPPAPRLRPPRHGDTRRRSWNPRCGLLSRARAVGGDAPKHLDPLPAVLLQRDTAEGTPRALVAAC